MFGAHQLQQNLLSHSLHDPRAPHPRTPFIELGHHALDPPLNPHPLSPNNNQQDTARKQRKRDRGKRQLKKYDSEE